MSTQSPQADAQPGPLPAAAAKGSVTAVWALALVAGAAIVLFSPRKDAGEWFSIAFGLCMVASLCLQLATQEKRGFVRRLAASVSGAIAVLAVASVAVAVLHS